MNVSSKAVCSTGKSIQKIMISGYSIEYVDLREPKPRKIRTETAAFPSAILSASEVLGIDLADHIRERYARSGYKLISFTKLQKREVTIDFAALYMNISEIEAVERGHQTV